MRVAVEGLQPVEAAEHEAEDGLAGQVALLLGPALHLVVAGADDQLAREHPTGADRPGSTVGTWMKGWPA